MIIRERHGWHGSGVQVMRASVGAHREPTLGWVFRTVARRNPGRSSGGWGVVSRRSGPTIDVYINQVFVPTIHGCQHQCRHYYCRFRYH